MVYYRCQEEIRPDPIRAGALGGSLMKQVYTLLKVKGYCSSVLTSSASLEYCIAKQREATWGDHDIFTGAAYAIVINAEGVRVA